MWMRRGRDAFLEERSDSEYIESVATPQNDINITMDGEALRQRRRLVTDDSFSLRSLAVAVTAATAAVLTMQASTTTSSITATATTASVNSATATSTTTLNLPATSHDERLSFLGFKRSSTQPVTPGDGSCGIWAILDSISKMQTLKDVKQSRIYRQHFLTAMFTCA